MGEQLRQPAVRFDDLTGQVLNADDADQNPSASSSGAGAAGAAALSMLTVDTETSGSIISPSGAHGLVGNRPTVGIVPAYGIGPISSSQDTAGRWIARSPMRPCTCSRWSAATRRTRPVMPPSSGRTGRRRSSARGGRRTTCPRSTSTSSRQTDRLQRHLRARVADGARFRRAGGGRRDHGRAPLDPVGDVPALPSGYQQHKAIDEYYRGLGANAPINSLEEEVAVNQVESDQALKFGNQNHANAAAAETEPGGPNETAYRAAMPIRRAAQWAAIDSMMNNQTPDDPSDDFLAILGSVPNGATAGTTQITIPMGYSTTRRRAQSVPIHGNAYSERNLIGVAYVIEQATRLRRPVSELNPSMYRCADTVPAPAYSERGSCNPDYESAMALAGSVPQLPFSLETETAQSLQARQAAGTLTAETLTRAYLARIAAANAEGPAVQRCVR
ncbi:hypothetical protein E1212_10425 [Jiangella ureilytica]|uniref:Amidase domain-containing protein n=1 Tax=Jiangella ureilytica TaxID=2530374 RepID=A0A4R4RU03_9ACTN|nr:amidase family protein [Jiangella ureilytica]TDC52013.1 hypothetical protein E1212_10425 [Jiangella ureilytica]